MNRKKLVIKSLSWDNWNAQHIARHNVVPDEVEEVCGGDWIDKEAYKKRIFLIGPTKSGRMLTIILEPLEENGLYRPITAYDASKRSIRLYDEEMRR